MITTEFTLAANGSSSIYVTTGDKLWLRVRGDFSGGVLEIETDVHAAGVLVATTALEAIADLFADLPVGTQVRFNLSGAATPAISIQVKDNGSEGTTLVDLPANFALLGINVNGHVSRVTLADTLTALTDNSITAAKIASSAITADKIATDAITAAKIASNAITSAKVADGFITAAKITDGSITVAKIADNAITAAKIAADAITSAKIAAEALTVAKFAAGAFDAVWAVAARTLTAISDSAGITTLLARTSSIPSVDITRAYDPVDLATWFTGSSASGTQYQGVSSTGSIRWGVAMQRLPITENGVYIFTKVVGNIAYGSDLLDNVDDVRLVVCSLNAGNMTVVATSNNVVAQGTAATGSIPVTFEIDPLSVTLSAGVVYHFGLAMRGTAARQSSFPGWRLRLDTATDENYLYLGDVGVATLPSPFTPALQASGRQFMLGCEFQTRNRIIYSLTSPTGIRLIPRRVDGYYHTKLSANVVTGSNSMTVAGKTLSLLDTRYSLVRNSAAGTLTFGGNSQAIAGQEGDSIECMIQIDGRDGSYDLLYQNLTDGQGESTADYVTISHAAKHANSRTNEYSLNVLFDCIDISGTGTISSLEVGWEPIVIWGDSMSATGRYSTYLPSAFQDRRMFWRAWISGNRLSSTAAGIHTAGYLRYKNTTIGEGDLAQFRETLFISAGFGLNDISQIGTGDSAAVTANYFARKTEVIDDILANGNQILIIGLAPYHSVANASTQEAQAIITWINQTASLATTKQVGWMTPWFDLVDQTTVDDLIPEINAIYTDDGGTHINSAGAELIAGLAADSWESGKVGGTWAASANRYHYPALPEETLAEIAAAVTSLPPSLVAAINADSIQTAARTAAATAATNTSTIISTFPANFASLGISVTGAIIEVDTVGSVLDVVNLNTQLAQLSVDLDLLDNMLGDVILQLDVVADSAAGAATQALVARNLAEADVVLELDAGVYKQKTLLRGTTTELIPDKTIKQPSGNDLTNPATQRFGGAAQEPV